MTPSTAGVRQTSPSTDLPSHYVSVGTSLHSPGREVPTNPLRRHSSSSSGSARRDDSPSYDELKQASSRTWDEVFPLPASSSRRDQWAAYRRTGSYLVVMLFIVGIISKACFTSDGTSSVGRLPSGEGLGTAHSVAGGAAASAGDDDDVNVPTAHSSEEIGSFADDHSHYHLLETLSAQQIGLDDPDRRVFFVGDIHGSLKQLKKLLAKIDYDPVRDVFIHVGDLVAKGPKPVEVLQAMREYNVKGVRGNHDQPVIQWRSWFERYLPGDSLTGSPEEQDRAFTALVDDLSLDQARKIGFPKDWEWEGEHFVIAKEMSRQDYAYLLSLPLQIHIPSLHTIVVHAGLLPYDTIQRKADSATLPWQDPSLTRLEAEIALLTQVAPNSDPWTLLNMRSVLKDGSITKDGKAGTPWSDIWNKAMKPCKRTDAAAAEDGEIDVAGKNKGCYPIYLAYGHAAGRGLDLKPHSFGLDSGCVYGRRLSALVLGGDGKKGDKVMVGEREGRLVSVSC